MSTYTSMTLAELRSLLRSLQLPEDTKLSITFEDEQAAAEVLKKKSAVAAINKLKGTGTGRLVSALLEDRKEDKLK